MKKLIVETTKQERKDYVQKLFHCHNGDCDNCGVCQIFKGVSPQVVFQDYIEGKREFQDIAKEFHR
ncbi:MAG: hypothetical protein UFX20_13795 [Longibaculum muris]|uniref:Uncharacterized protein n=1 Tax=Longibaculum muris TaxID=1796628 RepID=A0A4V2W5U3_9FIRM|nr:hypothetical protein [Longibaculum muris]KXU48173.1 hypothetical protein HMPREF3037_01759 [Candidatus Stoquefichus sp. KLE1796]MBS5369581.1 hypothetical protein [Coprobacillus cateniformis]MCR1886687.1 hypothetical protein [Longibaculum muris]MED9813162.1 hypothetical protein [Longibaculum muris]TCW01742.1 hypothetical protein EDD60_103202 [Longibaculum muris]